MSWQLQSGSTTHLADVNAFIADWRDGADERLGQFFSPDRAVTVSRAPGRLDLMGGIADYSGSLVLQMPIAEAACCAVQTGLDDGMLRIASIDGDDGDLSFSCPIDELVDAGEVIGLDAARTRFARSPADHWASYLAGTLIVLLQERPRPLDGGVRMLVRSAVPVGKGVSSSAALEVAAMQALRCTWNIDLDGPTLATWCQRVENHIVGAPCGIMDQMASACGEQGRLLALRCQPAELLPSIAIPEDLAVWGIDSGIRHAVGGADYGSVRVAAFMGYRILAELVGLPVEVDWEGVTILDQQWQGYLANVPPSIWADLLHRIPDRMKGADFLQAYGGTTDAITTVDPDSDYPVRAATAHPIGEHHRIRCFAEVLQRPASPERDALLGESMFQSHSSYSSCGLGSEGTETLVEAVRQRLPALCGAKITGGGSGGTVAVLGQPDQSPAIDEISSSYCSASGRQPHVFTGSSPGALAFGHLHFAPRRSTRVS